MSKLQEILEYVFGENRVNSYSGRSMYGRECLSVSGNDLTIGQVVSAIMEETEEDDRYEMAKVVEKMAWDSMGYGIVVYFPDVPYVQSEDAEDESEDEESDEDE